MNPKTTLLAPDGANPSRPYYPALDGLRALAVLMVFGVHYLSYEPGWMGVNIFFVLSGFLITGILFDGQDRPHRFRDFYIRRSLRIFPLYYAVWLALLLATPLLHIVWKPVNILWPLYVGDFIRVLKALYPANGYSLGIISYPFVTKPLELVYLNSGHFWSLCVEEQFYLIWPLVVFTVRKRVVLLRICIAGIIVVTLLRYSSFFVLPVSVVSSGVLHDLIFFRLDEFLVGGAAALVLRSANTARLRAAGPWFFWCSLAILFTFRLYPRLSGTNIPDPISQARWIFYFGITLADVLALGMILLCLNPAHWLSRLLTLPPLRALGKISYGFYIFHDIFHNYFISLMKVRYAHPVYPATLAAFVTTLILAIASYFFLERPFLRLKVRFDE